MVRLPSEYNPFSPVSRVSSSVSASTAFGTGEIASQRSGRKEGSATNEALAREDEGGIINLNPKLMPLCSSGGSTVSEFLRTRANVERALVERTKGRHRCVNPFFPLCRVAGTGEGCVALVRSATRSFVDEF